MKYLLSNYIALRSWHLVPYAYYVKGVRNAMGLKKDEYELLRRCDGQQEIDDSPLLQDLQERGLCHPAKNGETLSEWQKERICDNRYFPAINWMITGKCNYNCLHCFNAADNYHLQSEFTLEEAKRLIEEAEKCGINAFTITGGEPMLHPNFIDILKSIYSHNMYVEELNTNGSFITKKVLDDMKQIGCFPLIKISFDGIGHHDWLRNKKGAEENTLAAIRLCVENGFKVKVQTNVHKLNVDSILPTAILLDKIGVDQMRIIRTSESPRWLQNAKDSCLTLEEYFDTMIAFLEKYSKTDCEMEIDVWNFAHICPKEKAFRARAVECKEGTFRETIPVCRGNRGMIAIGANGNLYPCHQMSGYYDQHEWVLGNVKSLELQKLLSESEYLKTVCTTVKELATHNEECASCKWFKYCCGGCRAIGLALTGDTLGSDKSKCLFFNGNYIEKLQSALTGYYNTSPIK